MTRNVILSTPMLLEEGAYTMRYISLEEAAEWVKTHNPKNYVGHSTVRVLGIEPTADRSVCDGYDQALSLKVMGRTEFGREYTAEEILAIGVTAMLIERQ
jgi:hypothetical protein